jgi:hypothetical protein
LSIAVFFEKYFCNYFDDFEKIGNYFAERFGKRCAESK